MNNSKKKKIPTKESLKKPNFVKSRPRKCELCCFYLTFGQIWRENCHVGLSGQMLKKWHEIRKCHFLVHYLWWDQETTKCNCRVQEGKICIKSLWSNYNFGNIRSWFRFFKTIILLTLEFLTTRKQHVSIVQKSFHLFFFKTVQLQ